MDDVLGAIEFGPETCVVDVGRRRISVRPLQTFGQQISPVSESFMEMIA